MNADEHYEVLRNTDALKVIRLARANGIDIPVPEDGTTVLTNRQIDQLRATLSAVLEHIDSQIGKPGDIVNAEQGLTLLADTEWSERHWLEDRYNRIVVTMGRGLHYEGDVVRPAGHGPISYVTDDGTLHVAEGENFEVCFV